jgi:hypothetical protein
MFEQRKIMDRHNNDMGKSDAEITRPDLGKVHRSETQSVVRLWGTNVLQVFFVSILFYYISLYCLKAAWLVSHNTS